MKLRDIKQGGIYYVSFENEKRPDTASMEYEEWLVEVLGVQEQMGVTYIVVRSLRERKGVPNDMFGEQGYTIPRDWAIPRQPKTYYIDSRNINNHGIIPGTIPYSRMPSTWSGSRGYPLYAFFEPKLSTAQITYLLGRKGVPSNVAGIVSQFLGGPNAPKPPRPAPEKYNYPTEGSVIAYERRMQQQNPQPTDIYNIPGTTIKRGEDLYKRVTNAQGQWREYMEKTHNAIAKEKEKRLHTVLQSIGPVYGPMTERNTRKAKQIAEDTRANTMRQDLKEIKTRRAQQTHDQSSTNKSSAGGARRRTKVTSRLNRRTRRKQ